MGEAPFGVRPIAHRPRSAVDMDGHSAITGEVFLADLAQVSFRTRTGPVYRSSLAPQQVHLAFLVRRVGSIPDLICGYGTPEALPKLRGIEARVCLGMPARMPGVFLRSASP